MIKVCYVLRVTKVDDHEGQVWTHGEAVDLAPDKGDYLELWSGGPLQTVVHRVWTPNSLVVKIYLNNRLDTGDPDVTRILKRSGWRT